MQRKCCRGFGGPFLPSPLPISVPAAQAVASSEVLRVWAAPLSSPGPGLSLRHQGLDAQYRAAPSCSPPGPPLPAGVSGSHSQAPRPSASLKELLSEASVVAGGLGIAGSSHGLDTAASFTFLLPLSTFPNPVSWAHFPNKSPAPQCLVQALL